MNLEFVRFFCTFDSCVFKKKEKKVHFDFGMTQLFKLNHLLHKKFKMKANKPFAMAAAGAALGVTALGCFFGVGETIQASYQVNQAGITSSDAGFKVAVEEEVARVRAADGLGSNILQLAFWPGKEIGKWVILSAAPSPPPQSP